MLSFPLLTLHTHYGYVFNRIHLFIIIICVYEIKIALQITHQSLYAVCFQYVYVTKDAGYA